MNTSKSPMEGCRGEGCTLRETCAKHAFVEEARNVRMRVCAEGSQGAYEHWSAHPVRLVVAQHEWAGRGPLAPAHASSIFALATAAGHA